MPCACSVIIHRWSLKVVRTKTLAHEAQPDVQQVFVQQFFTICYFTDPAPRHKIYLFCMIKKGKSCLSLTDRKEEPVKNHISFNLSHNWCQVLAAVVVYQSIDTIRSLFFFQEKSKGLYSSIPIAWPHMDFRDSDRHRRWAGLPIFVYYL